MGIRVYTEAVCDRCGEKYCEENPSGHVPALWKKVHLAEEVAVVSIERCSADNCDAPSVGAWIWKAADMDVALFYCELHREILKAKLEVAGRMAGGVTFDDLKN